MNTTSGGLLVLFALLALGAFLLVWRPVRKLAIAIIEALLDTEDP